MTGAAAAWRAAAAAVMLVGAGVLAAPPADAAGPRITIDRTEVAPGEPILVQIADFEASYVNVSLCGNLAKRGAADCNVRAGVSEETTRDGRAKLTQLIAHAPPAPCPCLVRATDPSGQEFAVAPVALLGHPVAPVVAPSNEPLVEVAIEARQAAGGVVGALRAALGGRTRYEVTVSVRNRTTETLSDVRVSGGASHRFDDDAVVLDIEPPGAIEPGQTWEHTVVAEVPAPVIGTYRWSATASGAGSTESAEHRATATPVALLLLLLVLAGDLTALAGRFVRRRRRRRIPAAAHDEHLHRPDATQPTPLAG